MVDELAGSTGLARAGDAMASTAQELVSAARRHLGMDIAFVAEFERGRRIFRFVDAVPGAVRLEVGASDELADTYCQGIANGTIPEVIPDTRAEPTVSALAITDQLGIASYIGVPVYYADGRLFGTMCCLSHTKQAGLGEEGRRYLTVMAQTIAAELEQSERQPSTRHESRERIERCIAEQLFLPVYQPIVELSTGRVVGAEALTRFTQDDRGPLAWFAEAATVGLGVELELAAVSAALAAFETSSDTFLALNFSPSAFDGVLGVITRGDPGQIVVELTEHIAVADYAALQEMITKLRRHSVRIAVDDTGSGVSSLRHILEIRPDIIKLDLMLTIGIDTDPVKQALAQALASFATRIDTPVIAEGIETAEQMQTVADLGIGLGQGFHLGRPQSPPLPATAPHASTRRW